MSQPVCVTVAEASQVAEARRAAVALARALGFDDTGMGKAGLLATEAATNLLKHGRGGEIVIQPVAALSGQAPGGLELLALDKGPGMADVEACLRDGYSTAGSPGTGLGAMQRQSSRFDIYSLPGRGTALLAHLLLPGAAGGEPAPAEVGVVSLPKPGESACGDAWALRAAPGGVLLMVADGLGHGPVASAAAAEAVRVFQAPEARRPAAVLEASHARLRATRGAAVAVAALDWERGQVTFAGVGNVAGSVYLDGTARHMVSHTGTVGHELHRIAEFTYPWHKEALLVMHSDGLATQLKLEGYPGLAARHPSLIAGVLYRDHSRRRDDATVVVVRQPRQPRAKGTAHD